MGNLIALYKVLAKPERWFQEELAKQQKQKNVLFKFSALRYLWIMLFLFLFFFIRSDQIKMVRPLRPKFCPISTPPNCLTEWIMSPLHWGDHLIASCLLERKKEDCVFATDLAMWNSSHYPFLGLKLLSLEVPSHCALYQSVLEKSWIAYVQNFLTFILFWNFASLGLWHPGHPIWLWQPLQSVGWQFVDLLKFLSLPSPHFLVRFLGGLFRCTSCSLLA